MKYFPLIWTGLWRKKLRTIFTCLSITSAFLLYGVLHGVTSGLDQVIGQMSDARLRVQNRVSITRPLPIRYLQSIEAVPGIDHVAYIAWLDAYFRESKNAIQASAVEIQRLVDTTPDVQLTPNTIEGMQHNRLGAVVGRDLANQYGWKIGDRVPLHSNIWVNSSGSSDWAFDIVGIYTIKDGSESKEFWVNYNYFDEARVFGKGHVLMFIATLKTGVNSAGAARQIDTLFRNSPDQTYTQNDREWLRSLINQIGNVNLFVFAIIAAVLFALLFLTTNTMMQSIRERIPELAVLKVVGFSGRAVTALVFAEALLLCVASALLGLLLAVRLVPGVFKAVGFGSTPMPFSVVALGLALAGSVAFLSAVLPTLRLRRMRVADALAGL
jgi:putative ABC transport system permease protein